MKGTQKDYPENRAKRGRERPMKRKRSHDGKNKNGKNSRRVMDFKEIGRRIDVTHERF